MNVTSPLLPRTLYQPNNIGGHSLACWGKPERAPPSGVAGRNIVRHAINHLCSYVLLYHVLIQK